LLHWPRKDCGCCSRERHRQGLFGSQRGRGQRTSSRTPRQGGRLPWCEGEQCDTTSTSCSRRGATRARYGRLRPDARSSGPLMRPREPGGSAVPLGALSGAMAPVPRAIGCSISSFSSTPVESLAREMTTQASSNVGHSVSSTREASFAREMTTQAYSKVGHSSTNMAYTPRTQPVRAGALAVSTPPESDDPPPGR
jgi:hypothetical protein